MNITNKDKFASEFINRYTTRGFGAINKNRELLFSPFMGIV
jgi:hypothetical protein